jgi:GNAT superfamily N-acetyltransferase
MVDEQQWLDEMEQFISDYKNQMFSIQFPDCVVVYWVTEDFAISTAWIKDKPNIINHLYIRDLYVKPLKRKRGLAKGIIDGLILECKKNNVDRIELEPIKTSVSYFELLGFKWMSDERMYLNF